jgi:hypothetical protein
MDIIYPKIRKTKAGEHRCQQMQCSHCRDGHCPTCCKCGAPSFILTDSCKKCFACENIEGETRDDKKNKSEISQEIPLSQEEKHALAIIARGLEMRRAALKKEDPMEIKR